MDLKALSRRAWMAMAGGAPALAYARSSSNPSFVDILRVPDFVTAFTDGQALKLSLTGVRWHAADIAVETDMLSSALPVRVTCERTPLARIRLRWSARVPEHWRILNDQRERSCGDLEWRAMSGERVLPWYFLLQDSELSAKNRNLQRLHRIPHRVVEYLGVSLLLVAACLFAQAPTIRTDVPLVVIPVSVTDQRGHFVYGLSSSDFLVFDNGNPDQFG